MTRTWLEADVLEIETTRISSSSLLRNSPSDSTLRRWGRKDHRRSGGRGTGADKGKIGFRTGEKIAVERNALRI